MTRIQKASRHIRWNLEPSPDAVDHDGNDSVRYHIVVVDDKNRDMIMGQILESLSECGNTTPIRTIEGKVQGDSKLRFLFQSFDSLMKPDMINWPSGKPLKRDKDLKEKQRGNIEDYVRNEYK